jgi:membrane protein DedA with SNARE-associated domain
MVIPTLVATGLARVSWRRWFLPLVLAESIWTGTLVVFGYFFGQAIERLEASFQVLTIAGTVLLVIIILRLISRESSEADRPRP